MVLPLRSDGRIHPQPRNPETPTPPPRLTAPPKPVAPIAEKKWLCAKCEFTFLDPAEFIYHVRTQHPKARVIKQKKKKADKPKVHSQLPQPVKVTYRKNDDPEEERSHRGDTTLDSLQENQRLFDEARRVLKHIRRSYPHAQMCKSCFVIFKTDSELAAHSLKVHLPEPAAQPVIPKKKKKKPTHIRQEQLVTHRDARLVTARFESRAESGKPIKGTPHDQDFRERRMDATYGMGGFARDHGQFGSASSYDSMDDESSP